MTAEVISQRWSTTTLREAAGQLFTDGDWVESKDQDPDGEVRLIQLADIGDGQFLDKSARFLTSEKARQLRCTLLKPGDLLIARMADPIARCCIFPGLEQPAATVVDVSIVRPATGVDREYLAYAISNPTFRLEALGSASGTTRSRISRSNLGAISLSLPPLDEQRRIAEVLRSVDEAIAAQAALCSHLRQTTDDLADELFAREIADSATNLTAYGEACETVQVGIVVKPASYYVDHGGVPALRSTNIKRNEINFSALVQLSCEGHEFNHKSSLRAGDVVTIRTGEPGKTAVIPLDAPSPLNCIDIIFSRPKPRLRPYFAAYFINSSTARRQIMAMQGGLAQQHFNVGEMKKLKLPVPDLSRQDRLIEVLDAAWLTVRIEEVQLETLQATKAALMASLLSGRVRVPS